MALSLLSLRRYFSTFYSLVSFLVRFLTNNKGVTLVAGEPFGDLFANERFSLTGALDCVVREYPHHV
jgi:hypothetical protein